MSSDRSIDGDRQYRELRRRAFAFAVLGLFACVLVAAVLEPAEWQGARMDALDLLVRAQTGGARFTGAHAPALIAVGCGAGVLAGMLGMGGGVLKVAGMLLVFQLDILLARAVSLTTMFLATSSAAYVHIRSGTVLWQIVRPMILPAIVGVLLGMLLGNVLPRAVLTRLFAFFVLFLGFNMLGQSLADPNEATFAGSYPRRLRSAGRLVCSVIGGLHGFVCGLLGISGGVVAMPAQQALVRVPAHHAVANSVVVSAVSTSVGSLATVLSGVWRGDFRLGDVTFASLCIGGGAMLGANLGARLTGSIRVLFLKLMFVQVIFAAGLAILFH